MLLSIGDQVKPGSYRLHSVFKRAVNFEHRGRLISVVDETVGPGPLNIVLRAIPAGAQLPGWGPPHKRSARCHDPGTQIPLQPEGCARSAPSPPALMDWPSLRIASRTVLFAGHRYRHTRAQRYRSRIELRAVDPRRFHDNLPVLGEALKGGAPPKSLAFLLDGKRRKNFRSAFERGYSEQIECGVRQVFHGHRLAGIRRLKGCGLGLTPGGDDFIAGLLIGLHVRQSLCGPTLQPTIDAVFRAARGNNIFSNTFLGLARRGLVFGRMKDLLLALSSGSAVDVRRATTRLLAVGANSGADLAAGFFMAVSSQSDAGGRPERAAARLVKAR